MPEIMREEAKAFFRESLESYASTAKQRTLENHEQREAAICRLALAALEDAERYRYLCEWREWPDEVEAAFDCGDKLVIDAAIDRARGAESPEM